MTNWQKVKDYEDRTYHKADGMARIALDRLEIRNAFWPGTFDEMFEAFRDAWMDSRISIVLLTGNDPSPKDGKWAFCAGGDPEFDKYQWRP